MAPTERGRRSRSPSPESNRGRSPRTHFSSENPFQSGRSSSPSAHRSPVDRIPFPRYVPPERYQRTVFDEPRYEPPQHTRSAGRSRSPIRGRAPSPRPLSLSPRPRSLPPRPRPLPPCPRPNPAARDFRDELVYYPALDNATQARRSSYPPRQHHDAWVAEPYRQPPTAPRASRSVDLPPMPANFFGQHLARQSVPVQQKNCRKCGSSLPHKDPPPYDWNYALEMDTGPDCWARLDSLRRDCKPKKTVRFAAELVQVIR